jgi:hypothetical protein
MTLTSHGKYRSANSGSPVRKVAASIPSGLADQLSAAGLIDRAAGGLRSGAAAASAAGSRMAGASERKVAEASQAAYATTRTAVSQWPYWLFGLAVPRRANQSVADWPCSPASKPPLCHAD